MGVKKIIEVVFVLVGTIVGAGFATGNEIYQFFLRYGNFAYVLIAIFFFAMLIFTFKIMHLANKYDAYSVDDLAQKIFGEKFAFFISEIIHLSFFVFASVMLSAMGSIAGILAQIIMLALGFVFCLHEKKGILLANKIIVPLVFLFLIFLLKGNYLSFNLAFSFVSFFAILGVFYYISLNELISLSSLLVVVKNADRKQLFISAFLSCFLLALMILLVVLILSNSDFARLQMPILEVAYDKGGVYPFVAKAVLLSTIFTTFLSSIFGMYSKVKKISKHSKFLFVFILVLCFALSTLGFSSLITYAYNIIGFISLAILVMFILA